MVRPRAHGAFGQRDHALQRRDAATLNGECVLDHQLRIQPDAVGHLARRGAEQVHRQRRAFEQPRHVGTVRRFAGRQLAVGQHGVAALHQLAAQGLTVAAAVLAALGEVHRGLRRVHRLGPRRRSGCASGIDHFQRIGNVLGQQSNLLSKPSGVLFIETWIQLEGTVVLVLGFAPVFVYPHVEGRAQGVAHGDGKFVLSLGRQLDDLEHALLVSGGQAHDPWRPLRRRRGFALAPIGVDIIVCEHRQEHRRVGQLLHDDGVEDIVVGERACRAR